MHRTTHPKRLIRIVFWLGTIFITSYSFVGCKFIRKIVGCEECPPIKKDQAQTPPPNSVNLFLSASISDVDIKNRLINSFTPTKFTATDIVVRRCKCDENLINVALPNTFTIVINGAGGPLVVKSGDGATGGDVDLPISGKGANFNLSPIIVGRGEPKPDERIKRLIITSTHKPDKTVSIAIFDTGLDPLFLNGSSWQKTTTQCATSSTPVVSSSTGWNFTTDGLETNTIDNSPVHHGSRVANLIARQFNAGEITPKIVPMKVLSGSDNKGDLFELMCAMETARKNNIQVFNLSLGYYGDEDPLFKEYVKRAIDDKIIIVMAAGNQPDPVTFDRNFSTMQHKFYPAGFSMNFDRAIAVTTVGLKGNSTNDTLIGCPLQNYGAMNVLGVLEQDACRFKFLPGVPGNDALIEGSSYATPIMTGWLARKIGENPGHVYKWTTLPALLQKAKYGDQLYRNAYLKP